MFPPRQAALRVVARVDGHLCGGNRGDLRCGKRSRRVSAGE